MKFDGIEYGEDWLCIVQLCRACFHGSVCHCSAVGRQVCSEVSDVGTEHDSERP